MGDLTRNFDSDEFRCNHCGELKFDDRLPILCQKIRDKLGIPLRINSGYRCEYWNRHEGGVSNSQHLYGRAADLSDPSGQLNGLAIFNAVRKMYAEGKIPELGYCERYNSFCHVDVRTPKNGKAQFKG